MKKILPLLILAALLLVGCADMGEPGSTLATEATTAPAVTTVDRDKINNPEKYTELELKAKKAVWEYSKPGITNPDVTINNVMVSNVAQYGDAIVCYYTIVTGNFVALTPSIHTEEVLGYTFEYPYLQYQLYVFANKGRHTLQGAYDAGLLTEDNIRTIWEQYNGK